MKKEKKEAKHERKKEKREEYCLNAIPAGRGGGQFDPPCSFFYIAQKVLI